MSAPPSGMGDPTSGSELGKPALGSLTGRLPGRQKQPQD